jgi:hypothetical protein
MFAEQIVLEAQSNHWESYETEAISAVLEQVRGFHIILLRQRPTSVFMLLGCNAVSQAVP